MTSREVFEKKTGNKAYGELYGNFDPDYTKMIEELNALMLEALKAIDESINDNCISDAQMRIKNIIKHVSGEQEG